MHITRIVYTSLFQGLTSHPNHTVGKRPEANVAEKYRGSVASPCDKLMEGSLYHRRDASQLHSYGLHLLAEVTTDFDESFYTPQQQTALSEYAIKCLEKRVRR
jgi:hypothetical protein